MSFPDIPLELIVAIIVGVASLTAGLLRAHQAITEARGKVAKLHHAKVGQVDRLRRAARTSLVLKRNIREAEKRRLTTEVELEEAQARLDAADNVDHKLHVLDDRRTKADQNWIATIAHGNYAQSINHNILPDVAESWQRGRRFLIYALDSEKARGKAQSRYPDRLGYRLLSLTAQPMVATKAKNR